jgi:glutamate/tyrosine decarboxylase-like PLP-dependent enzyme
MLAARAQAIRKQKQQHPFVEEGLLLSKLMAYCSKEAHSCVEKAAMICFVKLRILEPDDKCSLRGATLQQVSRALPGTDRNDSSSAISVANDCLNRTLIRLQRRVG